ncbi:MAG: uncharacterized protein K0S79_2250 [Nitrospira sp.]|nr:uncharacterized protein [Nitrospira sp.]
MYDLKNLSKMKNLEALAPEAMRAFVAFDKAAVADGAIPGNEAVLVAAALRAGGAITHGTHALNGA